MSEQTRDGSPRRQDENLAAFIARLVDHLPGFVYRCRAGADQEMLFVSRGVFEHTGYTPEEVTQGPISYRRLVLPTDWQTARAEIAAAVEERRAYRCFYRITTADRRLRWMLERGEARYDDQGNATLLEGFITDHTERMNAFQLLEQRVADRTRQLQALYDILQVANSGQDVASTLESILLRVQLAVGAVASGALLTGENEKVLRLVAGQHLPEALVSRLVEVDFAEALLPATVLREGVSQVVEDIAGDDRTAELPPLVDAQTLIAVPILAGDLPRGVILVWARERSPLQLQDEVELLESVAEQVAVLVENQRLRRQAERLMILDERNRLARDLHDSVSQSLYSVTLFAQAGQRLAAAGKHEQAASYLADAGATAKQALKEMRLLLHRLRPPDLAEQGLVRALEQRLRSVEARAGIKNRLDVEGIPKLSASAEDALYYMAQEALNNSLKHAQATQVVVKLLVDEDGAVTLEVTDDGQGFDLQAAQVAGGLGLRSMAERAKAMGAELALYATLGSGTTVRVTLPPQAGTAVNS